MPIKLRGRTKCKPSEDSGQGEGNNHPDCVKPQKSKTLLWRLFSSSRRSVDNTSPASQPGDIPSCVYESGAILEEEYQESFGMTAEHSESVPSILRKITPPRLSDPPPGGATPTRHSAYVTSRGHRFATAAAAAAIYNEPCDARRAGSSSGGSTSTFKRTALRRASLAASIYCDTEHHRQDVFQPPSSPQGSPDSLQLTSSNHLREGSGSAGFTVINGWKNGVTSHMSQHWKEHDSGSSSLSNSRDIFSHTNPCLEMASPPAGSGSSTGHSPLAHTGGSMRVHSQSPPPPTTQPQLVARDHRQRQQQAPLAHTSSSPGLERRRNFSPRQETTATTTAASSSHSASPTLSNSPSFSNHPVVLQGNTQISHHPASPFAPIARTTSCGSRTSPSAASAAAATASSLRSNSDVSAPTRPCAQSYHQPAVSPPPEHQRAICSPCASASNSSAVRQIPDDGEPDGVQSTSEGPQPSRRRKDLAATYEEAWDVKMSRRLGGMDVSRLAEALPNSNFKRYDLVRASDRPLRSPATPAPVVRSPSLSPVLTSTEGIVMRQPRPAPRASFRNSSTDTVINREMMPSPFRLKQNRVASPTMNLSISPSVKGGPASPSASAAPITDYDYAYNRSWSMGVQLNLSLNLASNTDGSADQRVGPMAGEMSEKPVLSISGASSPPPPPPHRSASIMTPTTTQFSPPRSPTPMRRQCAIPHVTADVGVGMSPPSSRARGVHNPLASGVPIPLTPSSPPSEESSSTMRGDTSDAASTAATVAVPGLLPHMSRLLADWDNMSTDSCEEPWDVRHGKVISQLTSSRFIDPSEVLSAVANGNHNGAATGASSGGVSNGHSEGRVAAGLVMDGEGAVPMSPSSNISQPISCPSPLARSPSDVKTQNCLKPLNEQPWFHPNLTRFGAEKRLRSEPEGSFLVRNSETLKNEYSLTVKHNGFLHMRITRDAQGQFVLGEYSQPYPSIPHMISHYEQTQVPVKGADSVTLCHPR